MLKQFESISANRIQVSKTSGVSRAEFPQIVQLLGIPICCANILYNKCGGGDIVTYEQFTRFWSKAGAGDKHSTVFNILKAEEGARVLYPSDFEPLLYGILTLILITQILSRIIKELCFYEGKQ